MKFLAIKDHEKFQHYRDRAPVWIKLYASVLNDYAFLQLSEVTQRHLVMIWIAASRHANRLPYDERFIAREIAARGKVDLTSMIRAGFLVELEGEAPAPLATLPLQKGAAGVEQLASDPASTLLARPERIASLEREGEKRRDSAIAPGASETAAAVAERDPLELESEADIRRVLEHYVTVHPRRKVGEKKFVALVRRQLRHFSADELCLAIDGNAGDPWHAERKKHELGYVLRDGDLISGFIEKAMGSAAAATGTEHQRGHGSGSRITQLKPTLRID